MTARIYDFAAEKLRRQKPHTYEYEAEEIVMEGDTTSSQKLDPAKLAELSEVYAHTINLPEQVRQNLFPFVEGEELGY